MAFLDVVKLAIPIKSEERDEDISRLISAGFRDLNFADVVADETTTDPAIIEAVVTYVKMNFDAPENYDKLYASYTEQKAQLQTAHLV